MRTWKQWMPLVMLAILFANATPAWADNPRFEVTPFGGYRIGGSFDVEDDQGFELTSADLDDDVSWGVDLALYRDPRGFYELLYSRQETQFDAGKSELDGVDITTEYFHFGGTLIFDYEPWLQPYLSLTLGLTRFDAEDFGSEWKFSSSLGLGWRLPVNDNLAVLVGVRGYGTVIESDTEFLCQTGNGRGTCLVRSDGDILFQGEALIGVAFRF